MPSDASLRHQQQQIASSKKTRLDIEGLRAVAVLSVIFFHLKVPGFRGGFSGVDIFFVISGYLITRNIFSDIEFGRFTFQEFYARRVRRIFPAMLTTVAATLVFGGLWFSPQGFVELATSSISSLAFVANVNFWWDAHQYFSSNSDYVPLLHLWSLSVEEQFYIIWPILILIASRARHVKLVLLAGALVAVSLCATLAVSRIDKSAAFYLTPFRVYQFGLGALVASVERVISAKSGGTMLQHAGLVLCAVGIFAFGANSQIPSIAASLGAALVIFAGRAEVASPLLTNRGAVIVGRISYSMYLAHWPVVVFSYFIFGEAAFRVGGILLEIAVTFVLAGLMYYFIERPFLRRATVYRQPLGVFTLVAVLGGLTATSIAIIVGGGWDWRLNSSQLLINKLEAFGVAPCGRDKTSCTFGAPQGRVAAILIGDSYAQHYVAAIDKIAAELGVRAEASIQGGCLVLTGLLRLGYPDDRCRSGRDRVLATAKHSDAPIIISQAWMGYLDGSIGDDSGRPIDVRSEDRRLDVLRRALESTINMIARPNRRVLIIGSQVLAPCDFVAERLGTGPLPHARPLPCAPQSIEEVRRATNGVNSMLAGLQAKYPGVVSILFPEDYMCGPSCSVVRDGIWLYQDPGHLTVAGALHFGDHARNVIANFLLGQD
ncbi:peptidoglycan/LPS O-acetylase OafA/YrhL [Bradyrhizobium sp. LB7.2]